MFQCSKPRLKILKGSFDLNLYKIFLNKKVEFEIGLKLLQLELSRFETHVA